MQAIEQRGADSYQLSGEPYSYQAGVFDLVGPAEEADVDEAIQAERLILSDRKSVEVVRLRKAFWVCQLAGFACLIAVELLVPALGSALVYLKFIGLSLVLIASECIFLQRRKLKQESHAAEEEYQAHFASR